MDFLDGVLDVRVVVKRSVAILMQRSKKHLDVSAGERSWGMSRAALSRAS